MAEFQSQENSKDEGRLVISASYFCVEKELGVREGSDPPFTIVKGKPAQAQNYSYRTVPGFNNTFVREGLQLMYEYFCPDCHISEFSLEVEPLKQCPECHLMMEHIETEGTVTESRHSRS